MELTQHGFERFRERHGLSRDAAERLCKKALELGLKRENAPGRLKDYLDYLWNKNRTANNIRVYGEFIYIFSGETLITTWVLPQEYKKIVIKVRKRSEGDQMNQMGHALEKATTAMAGFKTPVATKPVIDVSKLMMAIEHHTGLGRIELAKKFGISPATLIAMFSGNSKTIGPAIKVLLTLHPAFLEAYNSIIAENEERMKVSAVKVDLIQKAMKMGQELKALQKQIQDMK
ncbi:hypothetical protein D3C87_125310 [compost metagenome]